MRNSTAARLGISASNRARLPGCDLSMGLASARSAASVRRTVADATLRCQMTHGQECRRHGPTSSAKLSALPADDAVVVRHSDAHSAALGVDVNSCLGRAHPNLCAPTVMVMLLAGRIVVIPLGFVRRRGNGEREWQAA